MGMISSSVDSGQLGLGFGGSVVEVVCGFQWWWVVGFG